MKRKHSFFIKDILTAIKSIEEFTDGIAYKEFISDKKTSDAVIRNIEIIGEAVKNIPLSIQQDNMDVPWREVARMRDKIVHHYFEIDLEKVWKVIKEDIPAIKPSIKHVYENLKNTEK
ncbi:MAG TPA: DUF86 domain-containing protein [Elusimicrobia bacterium]|nr:DUF86 domain-containing protein [Elusimicrobiota bacterium]